MQHHAHAVPECGDLPALARIACHVTSHEGAGTRGKPPPPDTRRAKLNFEGALAHARRARVAPAAARRAQDRERTAAHGARRAPTEKALGPTLAHRPPLSGRYTTSLVCGLLRQFEATCSDDAMNDREALLLSISLLEAANARLRERIDRGEGPMPPMTQASHVTAWALGALMIAFAAVTGYLNGAHLVYGLR